MTETEFDFSLANQAQKEFNQGNYEACLRTLDGLDETMKLNPKVVHNKHIVNFYLQNCKNHKQLLEFLLSDIAQFKLKPGEIKNRNISTVAYNIAVIYYHLRKPFAALEVLRPVMGKLEELDEAIASKLGLLILTLLLQTNQIKKAGAFWKSVETDLRMNACNLSSNEENAISDSSTVDNFNQMFQLISMLTKIMNKNPVLVPDDGSVEFALLKAHQYYVGNDFQMAAKQLSKKFTSSQFKSELCGEDQNSFIANNMGVIHLRVRHYSIAARFFQHAITFDINASKLIKDDAPLHRIGASIMPEILYNLGISMLHLQRPKEAFECFLVPLKIYHNNPRLWLRVAESCIMFYERNVLEIEKKKIVTSVVGSGIHRKYVLEPTPKIKFPEDGQSSAIPNPNLEFAALCLRNSVSLIEDLKNKFKTNNEELNSTDQKPEIECEDNNICNPSLPVTRESFDNLIAAIYASYSYVSIRLGDFVIALEYAKMLLELENLSDAYTMLGHLYCAESLVMLNRLSEARSHLEPKIVTNSNYFDFETRNWQLNSLEAAQSVIKYNLVVTLVLQGEFEVARALLATFTHPVIMTKVNILKMYIDLVTGKYN